MVRNHQSADRSMTCLLQGCNFNARWCTTDLGYGDVG
eukprot:SAG31_NODE_44655_length_262_cov_0.601227_1_plen_36_part_01